MRIYISCQTNDIHYQNFIEHLKYLGHEVSVDYFLRKKTFDEINEYDIFISGDEWFFDLTRQQFENEIRKIKSKKIFLAFDDEYDYIKTLYFTQFFDAIFTCDIVSHLRYKQIGVKSYHWVIPVNSLDKLTIPDKFLYDVSFIGGISSVKSGRLEMLEKLNDAGINVFCPSVNKKISTYEMLQIFNASYISLNFSKVTAFNREYEDSERFIDFKRGMKIRPLEIGGQSGFCLSEYSPGLEEILKNNQEIIFYEDADECIDQIKKIKSDIGKRNEIAQNSYRLVKEKYSVDSINSNINIFLQEIFNNNNNKSNRKIEFFSQVEVERLQYQVRFVSKYILFKSLYDYVKLCSKAYIIKIKNKFFLMFKFFIKVIVF